MTEKEVEITEENYQDYLPDDSGEVDAANEYPSLPPARSENVNDSDYDPGDAGPTDDEILETDDEEGEGGAAILTGLTPNALPIFVPAEAIVKEDEVTDLTPKPTAVDAEGSPVVETKTEVKQDAAFRGWRTLLQGLAVDVGVAIVVVLITVLPGIQGPEDIQWAIIGFSLLKSVVVAAVSYFARLLGIGSSTVQK